MALLRGKSNGMLKVSIENITKSDSNFAKTFLSHQLLPDMNFTGHCLTKNNTEIPKKVINLHMSYTLGLQLRNLNKNFTSGNSLFGSVKLAENADLDKCIYTGYDIGFDSRSGFLFTDGSYGKKNHFLGADMSSSMHVHNKRKNMLILCEGLTQGLDDTILTAEAKYPIHFFHNEKKDLY